MRKIFNKGHRIRASGKYLVYHFSIGTLLFVFVAVLLLLNSKQLMIDVAKQKLMNDPTFKHLSEDCQEYYFDFEAYASHLQEHGKFLVTEHGIFELPE